MNKYNQVHDNGRATFGAGDPQQIRGYFVHVPAPRAESPLDLRLISSYARRYKYSMALVFMLPVIAAIIVITMADPVYRSEAILAAVSEDSRSGLATFSSQISGLASLAGVTAGSSSNKDRALAILRSRGFIAGFIEQLELMPILFPDQWDTKTLKWSSKEASDVPTIAKAVELFKEEILSVDDSSGGELVTLRVEWFDRQLAAKWANSLVAQLNEFIRAREIAEAERSIQFLNHELEKNSAVEIRQGIFRLLEQQIEKIMVANVRQEYAFSVLDPAVAADADSYIYPKEIATTIAAIILGAFLAVTTAAIRAVWDASKEP